MRKRAECVTIPIPRSVTDEITAKIKSDLPVGSSEQLYLANIEADSKTLRRLRRLESLAEKLARLPIKSADWIETESVASMVLEARELIGDDF